MTEHTVTIKEYSGIASKVYEAICSCGWRGPTIKSHWYLDKHSADSNKVWHLASVEENDKRTRRASQ
jgi:hypothetical protein